jgi:hypothetical protein
MNNDERKGLDVAFGSILARLIQLEMKVNAAEKALEASQDLHAEYQKSLRAEGKNVENGNASTDMIEYLRKTILKRTE